MAKRKDHYGSLEEFVNGRIFVDEAGCWNWTRRGGAGGYRATSFNGKHRLVHRVSSFFAHGLNIDDPKQVVDHICRNKLCCNPAHLRIVDQHENIHAEGSKCVAKMRSLKTECPKCGGAYSVKHPAWLKGKSVRRCDPCDAEYKRNWERRKSAEYSDYGG